MARQRGNCGKPASLALYTNLISWCCNVGCVEGSHSHLIIRITGLIHIQRAATLGTKPSHGDRRGCEFCWRPAGPLKPGLGRGEQDHAEIAARFLAHPAMADARVTQRSGYPVTHRAALAAA